MRISWNWLNDYVEIDRQISIEEVSDILTSIGLEVESIDCFESLKGGLDKFYIGEVIHCERHPNADKLSVTQVDLGENLGIKNIVCGAPNVAKGQKVVVATEGATIYLPDGKSFEIKASKIRGEESQGMICAEDEIGVGISHDGILVLDSEVLIGTPAADYFEIYRDTIFEIGLTPNRTDAMSHRGVARDLVAALLAKGENIKFVPDGRNALSIDEIQSDLELEIRISDKSPIFSACVIDSLTHHQTPKYIKNRLLAIGESSRNILVDVTNYILHDLGQPLHAYDFQKIEGNTISVSELKAKDNFIALNGNDLKLEIGDLVIRDSQKIIGLAGVMGSQSSAVSDGTSSILLEAAYFDAKSIRKTSQRLALRTEAAIKFEKGIDPNAVEYALEKAKRILLSENLKAKVSNTTTVKSVDFSFFEVFLSRTKLNTYANLEIDIDKVESILLSLGIVIVSFHDNSWKLEVPRFKDDVRREEDVIEEVLRIYGYNNLPAPKFLKSNLSFTHRVSRSQFDTMLSNFLSGIGLHEVLTNSISQSKYYPHPIMLLNSMTSELDCMRSSLLPGILEVIEYNQNREQKDLSLFEIGHEYGAKTNGGYFQTKKLCIALSGLAESPNWKSPKGESSDYFRLKSIVEQLFKKIKLNFSLQTIGSDSELMNYGQSIKCENKLIGVFGELKIDKKHFDIKQRVFAAYIDVESLYQFYLRSKIKFQEIPKFPVVKRDLALVVSNQTSFEQIETTCRKVLGKTLVSVALFDIFKDKSIGESNKSYAIRLQLSNAEKTMSEKEIDTSIQKLLHQLKKDLQAELRA